MRDHPDLSAPAAPMALRLANRILGALGGDRGSFDEDELLERAKRRTGLEDFGPSDFREGLRVLLGSLERDANLHPLGRLLARRMVIEALEHRLRFQDLVRERQAPLAKAVRTPVVIVAMPRTGSTLLQRLLCEAPGALYLPMWLLMEPMPPPSAALWMRGGGTRRQKARLKLALQDLIAPGIKVRHEIRAEQPEEDTFLFMSSFVSLEYFALFPVFSYAHWLRAQPAVRPYQDFRQHLQLYQSELPGTHWVLKSPMHFMALDTLLEVFPEARIVLLHRDPRTVVPSMHSFFREVHAAASHDPQVGRMVAFNTDVLAGAAERVVALRDGPDAHRMIDVGYGELKDDPVATVARIHEACGLGWGRAEEASVRRRLSASPQHKHGRHRYSLEAFGLDDKEIERRFGSYMERFLPGC